LKGGETMLKIYEYNGRYFQFEEGEQPAGAVEVGAKAKAVEPPKKEAPKPANKARKVGSK
jgi:hypothetical protein